MPDLRVSIGGLHLANPVLVAAGTFGYGLEFREAVRLDRLGALVTKTITRQPRQGNPPPRLLETPSGMLNSVGLQNVGMDRFLQEKLPHLSGLGVPVIVSVLGESPQELAGLCARLDPHAAVAAIELNLSCPNIHPSSKFKVQGSKSESQQLGTLNLELGTHRMVSQDSEATFEFVAAARAATRKPIWAKLSPDVTDPRPVAQAAEGGGADALTLFNTYTGMSIDPQTRRSRLGAATGGLSGPAIRPLSVYRLCLVRQSVRCPLIGAGGVVDAEDALEYLLAGATAVEMGTANFANPSAAVKVVAGLDRYLSRHRIASVAELVGTAR